MKDKKALFHVFAESRLDFAWTCQADHVRIVAMSMFFPYGDVVRVFLTFLYLNYIVPAYAVYPYGIYKYSE